MKLCLLLGVLLAAVVAGTTACSSAAAPPEATGPPPAPNDATPITRLVAAMPSAVESVWVQDLERLLADQSIFGRILTEGWDAVEKAGSGKADVLAAIIAALRRAEPLVHVLGGSRFEWPKRGVYAGSCTMREIWQVRGSLAPLRQSFEAGTVAGFAPAGKAGEAALWAGTAPGFGAAEPRGVAVGFAGDSTLVLAPDAGEARAMLDVIAARSARLPPRWDGAADEATLRSPMFVLRVFDPGRPRALFQLARPMATGARAPHVLRLVVADVTSGSSELRLWTDRPQPTAARLVATFTGTDRPVKRLDSGWAAPVEPDASTPAWARGNYTYLVFFFAFGIPVFI